jgi:LacI family transcriptional regulator, galactose operon repressor
MKEKINVRTIAQSVDLSPITVSRALNGHPGVKTATRNKILKKVNELGYNYRSKSTTVRNDRTKRVAIHCLEEKLHGDIYFNFYGQLYFNFINHLKIRGYAGYTVDLSKGREENQKILDKCGSLILLSDVPHEIMESLKNDYSYMNIISIFAAEPNYHTVRPDDVRGGEIVAEHLIKNNNRHVAVFTELEEPCFRMRYSGFYGYMVSKSPESQIDLIRFNNLFIKDEADKEKERVLEEYFAGIEKLPAAIFATNGYSAIFLYNFLKKKGISVPDDIGLVGYDNFDYYQMIDVPLTRVCFDLKTLARQGIQLLDNILRKNITGQHNILIPVRFIDKHSVKKI